MICRICDSSDLTPVLDLGLQPWANDFLTQERVGQEQQYPLRLLYCTKCSCVQLDYTVPKEVMFADHTYVSGTTDTLRSHFLATAQETNKLYFTHKKEKSILDIGSNDGTQLKQYRSIGFDTIGVEACRNIAEQAIRDGIETIVDFFNETCAKSLNRKFDVVSASGVFFHLEELHSAARGVKICLKEDGVFVVQFLYMKSIVENLAFDQIYHEHLLYYTLATIEKLLNRHGLGSFDGYLSPIHGGSIILHVGHLGHRTPTKRLQALRAEEDLSHANSLEYYLDFARAVAEMKERTLSWLRERKSAGKRIFGFGAPVKGNTFLNYCRIGRDLVDCLVEKNPLRKGLFSPGMHIPIVLEDDIAVPPDVYLVLAWNFRSEILRRNKDLIDQGVEFYFPVTPRDISSSQGLESVHQREAV